MKSTNKEVMATPMKPSLYVTAKDLSAIKDWKVGKKYKLELEVTMRSATQDLERTSASFEIDKFTESGPIGKDIEPEGRKLAKDVLKEKAEKYS